MERDEHLDGPLTEEKVMDMIFDAHHKARREALEEAAQIAEGLETMGHEASEMPNEQRGAYVYCQKQIAQAIRARGEKDRG